MNATDNPLLEDKILSVKACFFAAIGMHLAQRAALEKLLAVRRQRFAADHASFVNVYESLAYTYLGYTAADLHTADELAQEAQRILVLTSKKGKYTFRLGKLIHLRCQIKQRMNYQHVALELGEEALDFYNNTNLLCYQRASLMHTLIHLHLQVGSPERAERLAAEVKVVDAALTTRRRF